MKRRNIFTSKKVIDASNIIEILRRAKGVHDANVADMDYLFRFEDGEQPLLRKKVVRPEIDCYNCDNIAHEVVQFHLGYKWSNPITLIQRGVNDSGTDSEGEAISLLNECYEAIGIKGKTNKLGRSVEIVCRGYTLVDINKDYEPGDSYFTVDVIDPRNAFVVRSSYYTDNRVLMGVTFGKDDDGITHFTCFTKDEVFEIVNYEIVDQQMNPLHRVNLIEWIGNYDDRGVFEHQIDSMNDLNLLMSDYTNSVENDVQAIWHANDIEVPEEEVEQEDGTKVYVRKKLKSGDWLWTETTADGKTPFVNPLKISADTEGMLNNIIYRRNIILEKCYVPQRNDDSGGSTGVAMQNATGYTATESVADAQQNIMESCKMEEVKVVLAAIKESPFIPQDSPLLKLKYSDIQPNIKRMKLSEISTKANVLSTLISHGVHGRHAFEVANIFPDTNQAWQDSKDGVVLYQNSVYNKQNDSVGGDGEAKPDSEKTMQDLGDQKENSPNIH